MNQEKLKIYTAEFRASAVKLANESDKSIVQEALTHHLITCRSAF